MNLTRETATTYLIRAWEPGVIQVDEQRLNGHVIISPQQIVADWQPPSPEDITLTSLAQALALEPSILLLGTGNVAVFPNIDLAGLLGIEGVGVEVMATPAACRTYNVLAVEGRPVVAALFNP
jgi:uncharacterized protein